MFVFEEIKLHTNLGVGGDVKRVQNRKGRKKENAKGGKKGSGKKNHF